MPAHNQSRSPMRSYTPTLRVLASCAALAVVMLLSPTDARAQDSARAAQPRASDESIRVTLLGTGTPRPLMSRFGPSTLVEAGREKIIVDAGRGVEQRLWELGVSNSDITAVLLTHLHSDHVVGLPDLWLTGWIVARTDRPLELWGPAGTTEMASHLEAAFAFDRAIRVSDDRMATAGGRITAHDIGGQVVFERNGVKVTSFLVDHGAIKPALGYRIDYAGHSVVLSGDTRESPELIRVARGTDLLIHEVAAISETGLAADQHLRIIASHHTIPERAGEVFTAVHPKLAVYSHIVLRGGATTADVMRLTRATYDGPLVVGGDLMRFIVSREVTIEASAVDEPELQRPVP